MPRIYVNDEKRRAVIQKRQRFCRAVVAFERARCNGAQHEECRNPSFGLATKAKGVARLRAKRKEAQESRQRHCKGVGQEEVWESHHKLLGVLESVREYEGMNPHTPKATPTLGDGVPVDSRNFRERLQGSNLNVL